MPYEPVIGPTSATDITLVPIALPYRLRWVNCYAARHTDGSWTLIDTGLNHSETSIQTWLQAFHALEIRHARDIRQVLLTHMHPDHFGMAGLLQQLSHTTVFISARDREAARIAWMEREGRSEVMKRWFVGCGADTPLATEIAAYADITAQATEPHPTRLRDLDIAAPITFGGRSWRIIETPGHSDGHVMFFSEADGVLLAGDHVLNRITPNIGLWPDGDASPLRRYLASLDSLLDLPVRLALTGHFEPIEDWRGRIYEIQAHHAHRLSWMADEAGSGATVYDVARKVFDMESLDIHQMRFALAETLAHLEFLAESGELVQEQRYGQRWFRPA
ncbi:MAG: MBL fold metallo-hydrolase [Pleurocapsa minor GSE-CHR-MK-17-07R]|nr:MBL fold metallo-hydrolase [Pleurocapsa minor GSE-CHR-MK 17-07R]